MEHPYATEKCISYENFEARCPICGYWNIFNRATDFGDFKLISFKTVSCLNSECLQQFNINGDLASPDYQMFIMQCCTLKEKKQYMLCIIVLSQAFEIFFSSYLLKTLVLEPLKKDPAPLMPSNYHALADALYEQIKRLAFQKLRNVFLNITIKMLAPSSISEAMATIRSIPDMYCDSSDCAIDAYPLDGISALLHSVKRSRIAELRNRVVHKEGYRPRLDEVETAMEEACKLIFGLHYGLVVQWYV
jgi:hypothetical protein